MKRLFAALALLGLAACNLAATEEPLFSPGAAAPREGLWARLDEGCAAPATPDVARWPACAEAFWVSGGQARVADEGPAPFIVTDGDPPVVQIGPMMSDPELGPSRPVYMYLGARPEGAAPYVRARIWYVYCPEGAPAVPEVVAAAEGECRPLTPRAVRGLSALAMASDPSQLVVWVAPLEQAPPPPLRLQPARRRSLRR